MKVRSVRVSVASMVIAALVVAWLGIAHVGRRQEAIRLGFELSERSEVLRRLEDENRRLRLEKSRLTRPQRIEQLAEEMGMVRPGPGQIRTVDPDRPAPPDRPDRSAPDRPAEELARNHE